MNLQATLYKDTMFGSNEEVLNIPSPTYNFAQHETKVYNNVQISTPLLMSELILQGVYSLELDRYDYMVLRDVEDNNKVLAYYFINAIVGDNVNIAVSVTMDVLTTHSIVTKPVTGVIIRKHDTNLNETKFDYPTALQVDGRIYNKQVVDKITYSKPTVRLIESAIDLSAISSSQTIVSNDNQNIVVPKLPQPKHKTRYIVEGRIVDHIDNTGAYTLYDADLIDQDILDTVRGLSGDGAISDSYTVPSEAVEITRVGEAITQLKGKFITTTSQLKLEAYIDSPTPYIPKNEATKGLFRVGIQSMITKESVEYEGWNLKDSGDSNGFIKFDLWCDPKPSGNPYCAPNQVETLHPNVSTPPLDLSTQDMKSIKGKQWLRNPLVYTTAQGSKYTEMESLLQKRQAKFEYDNAVTQLEIGKKERDIQLAQADYAQNASNISTAMSVLSSASQRNLGGVAGGLGSLVSSNVNAGYTDQLNKLKEYEYTKQKEMATTAYRNNLSNIELSSKISRNVPVEVSFTESESLGSYEQYNGFNVYVITPDYQTIIAKDREFSKYGYPVYQPVEGFVMNNNLRVNHSVFQFENPMIELGGTLGDLAREVLQNGIRILSNKYSVNNILNNPKRS